MNLRGSVPLRLGFLRESTIATRQSTIPSMTILSVADDLTEGLRKMRFSRPVTHVYNPLEYAREVFAEYAGRFGAAGKEGLKKLSELRFGEDQFHIAGKEIYLRYANGYGNSKMTNNLFEKVLGMRATTRNWNTVNTLYAMATEPIT